MAFSVGASEASATDSTYDLLALMARGRLRYLDARRGDGVSLDASRRRHSTPPAGLAREQRGRPRQHDPRDLGHDLRGRDHGQALDDEHRGEEEGIGNDA